MQKDIFQKIEIAPKPDFGNILSKSFDMFKITWKECLSHGLISLLIAIPFLILVYAPLMPMYIEMIEASMNGRHYSPDIDLSTPFLIGYIAIVLVLSFIMQILGIGVAAHFYQVLKKTDTNSNEEIGGYFVYIKEHFTKLLILSLAAFAISIVAAALCYLPIFYVMVPLQLITPIFAFNKKLSARDIIKAAFQLGNKYWLTIFGLVILSSMIAQIGVIACFIGIFVTAYFVHIPMYYLYKETIGFDEDNTEDDSLMI